MDFEVEAYKKDVGRMLKQCEKCADKHGGDVEAFLENMKYYLENGEFDF